MAEIIYLLAATALAALVAFTSTPAVSVLAYKIGAIDVPKDSRRMHKKPTPRIGGLAIYLGFVVAK
ncbi:MAG: undecaprenyl/decaprenyl-phosphate alpha-N-acetylglucosaminyl 1-phosphate transferase, partial [Clostridia bacterium]|nr:undecaprenyl/decaprenyl-phosphate alpha-N-acetylglucosaminyl 1-phosphate transferase [Clostridia bacterium]